MTYYIPKMPPAWLFALSVGDRNGLHVVATVSTLS